MSTTALSIPIVTEPDLLAFHFRTFGYTFTAASTSYPGQSSYHHDDLYDEDTAGIDDSLGYYSDGAKRTLTDEQIKIFRHSEIHALRRKRELEKEEAALAEEDSKDVEVTEGLPTPLQPLRKPQEQITVEPGKTHASPTPSFSEDKPATPDDEADEEAQYAEFLEKERREFAEEAKKQRQNDRRKKGGWNRRGSGSTWEDRTRSTRRKVRELDTAAPKDVEVVLDY